MKRTLAVLLALIMALALTACGEKPGDNPDALVQPEDGNNPLAIEPALEDEPEPLDADDNGGGVVYGHIAGMPAPEGWTISDRSADDYLIYVEMTEDFEESEYWCPYLQFGYDEYSSPEELFAARQEMYDHDELTYSTEDVTIAGIAFHKIIPDLGEIQLYGAVDGLSLIITHGKDVDESAPAVADIVGSIRLLPED